MMVARKSISYIVIAVLISQVAHASYPPRYHHYYSVPSNDFETAGKMVVAAGCLAAIGYGIYKFCDWLFTPSNERLLQNGIDALHDAHQKYDATIAFFGNQCAGIPVALHDQKKVIQRVDESLLYEYAIAHKRDISIETIVSNMGYAISSLQSAHSSLSERIKKLRKSDGNPSMINSMQQVDQEIIGFLCKLEFVYEYFTHHRNYYSLFELERRILRTYDFELSALNQYEVNMVHRDYFKEAVRASVMRQASARNGYPYMQYVDRVQGDCNILGGAINSLSYNYANRLSAAGMLLQHIQMIHTIVVAEDAYHQELRDYKKEQLERERIEAERAKAAAAAAHAAAAQQQAWQMQRQNQLHAQQIRVDAERNAIMAAQTVVNAFNPPQTNVHVYT